MTKANEASGAAHNQVCTQICGQCGRSTGSYRVIGGRRICADCESTTVAREPELCGDEFKLKLGYFCQLPKGHAGDHESECPNPQFHQSWPSVEPAAQSQPMCSTCGSDNPKYCHGFCPDAFHNGHEPLINGYISEPASEGRVGIPPANTEAAQRETRFMNNVDARMAVRASGMGKIEYVHLPWCNGPRDVPPGTKGVSCCCRIVSSGDALGVDAAPISLNDSQETIAKQWARDDRLWTTQETVEFNLRTFARAILAATRTPAQGQKEPE